MTQTMHQMTAQRPANMNFSGRIAAIPGGANGIGLTTAHRMVASGATVSLWDIDEKALAKARGGFPGSASVVTDRVDVTNAEAVARAADKVDEEFGRLSS